MKKLIVLILSGMFVGANAQNFISSPTISSSGIGYQKSLFKGVTYPGIDTFQCHFLEVLNDSTFKWQSGFAIRKKGFFDFGETSVSIEYLPITDGIVSSLLFYNNMLPIKKYAIKIIIIKPKTP